jgi:phosphatidylglycerol:prolipoprotein diacylglycerol transferase
MFAIAFPMIDPVLVQIGPFAIRWYALAYIAGLLLGWRYCRYLAARGGPISPDAFDDFLTWATIGTVLGGRLGDVLFYRLGYFIQHPLEVFAIWQGGMSYHGGMIGVLLAIYFFARKRGLPWMALGDLVAAATPIGLFFGRLANFINAELWGRVSDVPWAMVFPGAGPLPRHPSQLYEALLEGAVLFAMMLWLAHKPELRARHGFIGGAFLAGYGVVRSIGEIFREPEVFIDALPFGTTWGQWLCVPMIVAGAVLMRRAKPVHPASRAKPA